MSSKVLSTVLSTVLGADEARSHVRDEGSVPERLDRVLARAFDDLSRARLQALVRDGLVQCDGAVVRDPARKVGAGSRIDLTVPAPLPAEPLGEALPLAVVHEDEDLIVIDKPAGLVVHPAAGHEDGTLVNRLIAHCGASLSGIGGVRRPGIVHRLDKDTSGLLVVAKNDLAHQGLSAQFADHGRSGALERAYLALVWGVPEPRAGTIRANLARSRHNREKIAVVRDGEGREAITHYRVEALPAADGVTALLRCRLETGRTHQIRVHLQQEGHPLVADAVYGGKPALGMQRQALHAMRLSLAHPITREVLSFEAELPPDMAAAWGSVVSN